MKKSTSPENRIKNARITIPREYRAVADNSFQFGKKVFEGLKYLATAKVNYRNDRC